ncbi:MAG: hypothetical protein LBH70_05000 [Spirochaetaceae bacterium]|nr:hypothetical protein [Spirochaetaceae bacterium]
MDSILLDSGRKKLARRKKHAALAEAAVNSWTASIRRLMHLTQNKPLNRVYLTGLSLIAGEVIGRLTFLSSYNIK